MFFFSWNSKVGGFPRLGEEREKKFKQMKKKNTQAHRQRLGTWADCNPSQAATPFNKKKRGKRTSNPPEEPVIKPKRNKREPAIATSPTFSG